MTSKFRGIVQPTQLYVFCHRVIGNVKRVIIYRKHLPSEQLEMDLDTKLIPKLYKSTSIVVSCRVDGMEWNGLHNLRILRKQSFTCLNSLEQECRDRIVCDRSVSSTHAAYTEIELGQTSFIS